jgi:hypothetical protein
MNSVIFPNIHCHTCSTITRTTVGYIVELVKTSNSNIKAPAIWSGSLKHEVTIHCSKPHSCSSVQLKANLEKWSILHNERAATVQMFGTRGDSIWDSLARSRRAILAQEPWPSLEFHLQNSTKHSPRFIKPYEISKGQVLGKLWSSWSALAVVVLAFKRRNTSMWISATFFGHVNVVQAGREPVDSP